MQESFASVEFWESLSLPDPFLNFIKESGTVQNGFLGIPPHFRGAEKKELKKKEGFFTSSGLALSGRTIQGYRELSGFEWIYSNLVGTKRFQC